MEDLIDGTHAAFTYLLYDTTNMLLNTVIIKYSQNKYTINEYKNNICTYKYIYISLQNITNNNMALYIKRRILT